MFDKEGPVQYNDRGVEVGQVIIAKNEGANTYSAKLMGEGWHGMKLYDFGTNCAPDMIHDYGWIPAEEVRTLSLRAEVGIIWS